MSDLIERQKALDGLKYEMKYGAEMDSYGLDTAYDIIENIPSAEPERKTFHVIDKRTGEEADTWEIALNEKWAKSLCYCDMEGFAILEDGTLILTDECGRFEYIQEEDRFEIIWDEVNDED